MADKGYHFETDENGVLVEVDHKTGKRTPVSELVRQAAERGDLLTMEQQMANEHYFGDKRGKKARIDTIEEV